MMIQPGGGGRVVSSSPGREKLPAPPGLARSLYSKAVGGRSRCRSGPGSSAPRSSPMLVSRSRSRGRSSSVAAAAAAAAGEPSSPKVTCIGQVRIRLSMPRSSLPRKASSEPSPVMPCRRFHKGLLCGLFPAARKRPAADSVGGASRGRRRSLWRRWCCIRSSRSASRYQQRKQDPLRPPPLPLPEFVTFSANKVSDREEDRDAVDEKEAEEEEDETAAHEGEADVFVPSATALPPKNALLLMRCRSAPHNRASSLATAGFAVSPVPSADPPSISPAPPPVNDGYHQQQEERRQMSSGSGTAGDAESTEEEQADEANGSESRRQLVLPRSKSEPARGAAEKLGIPEATSCFWPSHSNGGSRRRRSSPTHDDQPSPAPAPLLADT